ncbi:MAG TPA: phosphatase PAP2 family protein [Flavitalea sp.]|nr:phosphatase PAP2 family protein [Flavitalea sp.]
MVYKFVVVLFLAVACTSIHAQNWDVNTVKFINPQNPDSRFFRKTSSSVYFIGTGAPVGLLLAGVIRKDSSLKFKSYEMFGAAITELTVSALMKIAINRPRPDEKYPADIYPYRDATGKSMPSGHTSLAFATAASLSLQFKKWYVVIPSYLWAASVGYSRMYLGVHYPSDIAAGAAVGVGSAYLANWLNRRFFQKKMALRKKVQ